jgi:CBS domain-containing protein
VDDPARPIDAKPDPPVRQSQRRQAMTTVAAILKHKGYQVTTIDPTATIALVVDVLAAHRIGAALVIDRAEQLLGIVSERDIVRCLAANGARTLEMTAGQLMTRALQVAHPETTVAEAMSMMTHGRFRHLPVLDHDRLVGLISIGDVVKARIMEQESEVDSLKAYVSGSV